MIGVTEMANDEEKSQFQRFIVLAGVNSIINIRIWLVYDILVIL